MKSNFLVLVSILCFSIFTSAQTPQSQPADSDMLGMTCNQILAKSSSEWLDQFTKTKSDSTVWIERGLAVYGQCYDKRTDALAQSLAQKGTGPLMGGMGNLHDMQSTLAAFTSQALNATSGGGTYDRVQAAFANLYQKQFTYMFYQKYMNSDQPLPAESDPKLLNQAKERLGELTSQSKGEQEENLQDAFDQFRKAAVEECGLPELPLYLYAINIMQSPVDPPFSKPPF
jgi:hypothetical protein